jgi:hypothetical protein
MKKLIFSAVILLGGMIALYHFLQRPITFASAESRTSNDQIVYNEITWQWKDGKDIWIMRQSHDGIHTSKKKWDKLVIVVENHKSRFYQLAAGHNEYTGKEKEVPFKVSCFLCHSNGPWDIRPMESSLLEKAQVGLLNLRIKLYGRLGNLNTQENQIGDVPFRHPGKISNAPLTLPACMKCHKEDGFFARGPLTRQNAVTVDFMVKNAHMPPIGEISAKERNYLKNFMDGF